jgi:hypothetical protein
MVRIRFYSTKESEQATNLELRTINKEILFLIRDTAEQNPPQLVLLDIPTAVRLYKELRSQIGLVKGANNV